MIYVRNKTIHRFFGSGHLKKTHYINDPNRFNCVYIQAQIQCAFILMKRLNAKRGVQSPRP